MTEPFALQSVRSTHARRGGGRLARVLLASGLGVSVLGLTGCVSQAELDRLYETNRSLTSENGRLKTERDQALSAAELLRGGSVDKEGTLAAMERRLRDAESQRDQAIADLKNLETRFAGLQIGPLDAETDRELSVLARQFPDLITYDPASGMLRVASDLTFDSGRADVKPAARPALQALARVLTSGAAAQYEIIVEGHTDAQRISASTAKAHPTNLHLSVHRSIGVYNELASLGVPREKLMAAGWGEHRPAVPNNPGSGNTPANRRVEIFLVKARGPISGTGGGASTRVSPDNSATPTRQVEVTK